MDNKPVVYGPVIDKETRCVHYHTALDIIAIKFKCCGKFYPCYKCHNETEKHVIQRWATEEFSEPAILCGHCQSQLSIAEYMSSGYCPHCGAQFNSRCKAHYHIYFEVSEAKECPLKKK